MRQEIVSKSSLKKRNRKIYGLEDLICYISRCECDIPNVKIPVEMFSLNISRQCPTSYNAFSVHPCGYEKVNATSTEGWRKLAVYCSTNNCTCVCTAFHLVAVIFYEYIKNKKM